MDGAKALALIRSIGYLGLAGADGGCVCASCEVQGVTIESSCHKGGSQNDRGPMVRVSSRHDDARGKDLEAIAVEVAGQLRKGAHYGRVRIRYCDSESDRVSKCVFCGQQREPSVYLCPICLARPDASDLDYSSLVQSVGIDDDEDDDAAPPTGGEGEPG